MLREDVERRARLQRAIERAIAHGEQQRSGGDELILGQREHAALRRLAERVARAAHALQERRDRVGGPDLQDEVDVADVDAEFERRSGNKRLEFAVLEPLLRVESALLGQRAVMARHRVLADALRKPRRDALRHFARVDEHERRAVLLDELRHAREDLAPRLRRADGLQRRSGQLQREVEFAPVPRVDDRARAVGSDEQRRRVFDGLLRRGQSDALQGAAVLPHESIEPLHREREVAATLVACERMDLVDDQRAHGRELFAAASRGEKQVERLWRRDEDVRRRAQHRCAFATRRVARAHLNRDFRQRGIERAHRRERSLQVLLHVVRQRLQRRHVEDLRRLRQFLVLQQLIDRDEERRERLARSRRRRDQRVLATRDRGPAHRLWARGLAERLLEPSADRGMECGERHGGEGNCSFPLRGCGGPWSSIRLLVGCAA